jgi:hypothetical protein
VRHALAAHKLNTVLTGDPVHHCCDSHSAWWGDRAGGMAIMYSLSQPVHVAVLRAQRLEVDCYYCFYCYHYHYYCSSMHPQIHSLSSQRSACIARCAHEVKRSIVLRATNIGTDLRWTRQKRQARSPRPSFYHVRSSLLGKNAHEDYCSSACDGLAMCIRPFVSPTDCLKQPAR